MRWRRVVWTVWLALFCVRCASAPQTREERECEKRVNACLSRCPAPNEPVHPDLVGPQQGCHGDSRSPCEAKCHDLCNWQF